MKNLEIIEKVIVDLYSLKEDLAQKTYLDPGQRLLVAKLFSTTIHNYEELCLLLRAKDSFYKEAFAMYDQKVNYGLSRMTKWTVSSTAPRLCLFFQEVSQVWEADRVFIFHPQGYYLDNLEPGETKDTLNIVLEDLLGMLYVCGLRGKLPVLPDKFWNECANKYGHLRQLIDDLNNPHRVASYSVIVGNNLYLDANNFIDLSQIVICVRWARAYLPPIAATFWKECLMLMPSLIDFKIDIWGEHE